MLPKRIPDIAVIRLLVNQDIIVICAGGGGIPVVRRPDGSLIGIEAVIDKDRAGSLLAQDLGADAFLMLTDVDAVYLDWGKPDQKPIRRVSPNELRSRDFAAGSMGPKVEAACDFAAATGGVAGIGTLEQALPILKARAGTQVINDSGQMIFW